ncbi:MAG: adenylosuccinate synthetase [Candidatus Sungbacteria bacterium]|uniref:Adenylosuccinate synthetase n=1 Tax=Candidatus Sungiibacteriota bacterium TaxID=2750080 RepID=A0A932R145_9BACT|nr:adenylosuccinate synthetase [Candidatus Sungbacteria bacterium]
MIPTKLLNDVSTLAIVCTQWGDTGKGKFVDFFAEWADIIARGTGGANAGHTIRLGAKTYILHLVPSGILHDSNGKINIIGNGVAFDPRIFSGELEILSREGVSFKHLCIAHNARLVLPQHIVMDRLRESSAQDGKIGTTGMGIGPTYVDHYARVGLTVNDLLNVDPFARKLKRNLSDKQRLLAHHDPELIREIMHHKDLENGAFWRASGFFDHDAIVERYRHYGRTLREMIRDTDQLLNDVIGDKRILLEGAQGNLLSIDYGTYPYVTASDCSVQGLARGIGIRERHVDLALGVVKAFYMTRVGEGPFPTEFGGDASAQWCNSPAATAAGETMRYPDASVNSENSFMQGVGIRRAGNEYGATTKRPRRTGRLDLPLMRYSKRHTGPHIILTKLDVLDECERIEICNSYRYEGPGYTLGERRLAHGDVLHTAIPDLDVMRCCVPQYETFEGWRSPTGIIRVRADLPANLKQLIAYVATQAKMHIAMLSVGPDREQTIVMDDT